MRRFIPAIVYLAAIGIMMAVGTLRMPYGYYTLLRLVVFVVLLRELWLAYRARRLGSPLGWAFIGLAILYNPLLPVHLLDKDIWTAVNFATWLLLAWTEIQLLRKQAITKPKSDTEKIEYFKKVEKVEAAFYLVYILLPMFTGWFEYHCLPNECYDETRHELLESHDEDVSEELGVHTYTFEVPDVWRNKATGKTYTPEMFLDHQHSDAKRRGVTLFAYGLIGCVVFAYCRFLTGRNTFLKALRTAMLVNLAVSFFMFFMFWTG